jgi:hypothetical protein
MNQRIKEKIEQYKKTAENGRHTPSRGNDTKHGEGDGLAKVTRGVFQKVCQASLTDEILSDHAGSDSAASQNIIRR